MESQTSLLSSIRHHNTFFTQCGSFDLRRMVFSAGDDMDIEQVVCYECGHVPDKQGELARMGIDPTVYKKQVEIYKLLVKIRNGVAEVNVSVNVAVSHMDRLEKHIEEFREDEERKEALVRAKRAFMDGVPIVTDFPPDRLAEGDMSRRIAMATYAGMPMSPETKYTGDVLNVRADVPCFVEKIRATIGHNDNKT